MRWCHMAASSTTGAAGDAKGLAQRRGGSRVKALITTALATLDQNAPTTGTRQEGLRRVAVAIAHRLPCLQWRSASPCAESALPGHERRRVVVGAHDAEGDERREQRYTPDGLQRENDEHRQRQRGELPGAAGSASAMARNGDRETVPANDSASPSISCSFARARPVRITAATNSVHTNGGSVKVGFSVRRANADPSATLAAISMTVTVNR